MSGRSRSLLALMKHTARTLWPQLLQEATASLLTEALLQETDQPEIAHMFEKRTAASLVCSPMGSFTTCQAQSSSICYLGH